MKNKRELFSFDLFKTIGILAIIIIHVKPFEENIILFTIVNQLCRFAVGCFFLVSGYLMSKQIRNNNTPYTWSKYNKRLIIVILFWNFVYMLNPSITLIRRYGVIKSLYMSFNRNINHVKDNFLLFLFQGISEHLWFLVALLISVNIVVILRKLNREEYIFPLSVIFFIIFELVNNWKIFNIPMFNFRNGPFVGLIFFYIGYKLFEWDGNLSIITIIKVIIIGIILHFLEASILYRLNIKSVYDNEFLIGTIFYSLGVFLLLLRYKTFSNKFLVGIAGLGKYSLGIYAIHCLFIGNMLNKLVFNVDVYFVRESLKVMIVYSVSLIIVYCLSKYKLFRKVVI